MIYWLIMVVFLQAVMIIRSKLDDIPAILGAFIAAIVVLPPMVWAVFKLWGV